MRKCKQVISMILALTLLFTMMSVGIVQTAAADDVVIYTDPPSQPALLGDVNRDGRVNMQDVYVLRSSVANKTGYLKYKDYGENTIEFKVADVFKDYEVGLKETIDLKDVYLLRSWIAHREEAQGKGIGEPVDTTATITIYGLNGQSETRKFNKGDSFNVYTSLNVKKSGEDVQIAAASGEQTFTDSVLTLSSAIDDDQLFTDTDTVFPVFGDKAMGRLRDAGLVQYNASTPGINNGFVFDSDDDLVIVTRYTVTKGGTGEVRNALSYLAAADDNLTKLVNDGVVDPEASLTVNAKFDKPGSAPTEAPTDAPVPTEAPTDAPTDAPTPTEAPTDAPVPTEAPTDAPTPGEKLTVTVVSLDGVEDTKTFDIGETFTVYTTLNTSAYENGGISALNGSQSYKVDFLEFADKYDSDTGDILNPEEVFPVVGDDMVANGKTPGTIKFNASKISLMNPYRFDDNNDILVKTQYKATAPGETRIVTEMLTLAIADKPLTKIINQGEIQDGYEDFRMHSSFTWPEENPTEAPTDAPVPTEAPTDAPVPTEAPTDAPVPTEAPTDAPVPTEAPTDAPEPSDTYIVAGNDTTIFGTSWNGNDTNNTMTKGDDGIYTKQYTVDAAKNAVQLKAVKNGSTWIGDETGNNVTFNLTGPGTFTVYCDGTKTWVDGDNVAPISDLDVQSVTAVGNGSTDGDNWLNNIEWNPAAAANHMTKVGDTAVYEIEYTLGEYDPSDVEFKFAINDAWTDNFGLADGVIANGVETDAIYNGPTNLKITGLTAGTTIKMQLDLTGFDYNTKTGAKMTITWTVPSTEAPTDAPIPTEAPTDAPVPTEAPTDAPTPGEKLTVTVVSLDGVEDTKTFDIGETFTVYTTLNTSAYENGGISALNGSQSYKVDFLEFADKYDSDTGDILNPEEVFPVVGDDMVANGKTPGTIKFNASTISLKNPYRFDDNNDILVKTQYKVKAPGETRIVTEMLTLAIADQPLTKIIDQGEIQDGYEDFRMHSSFTWPEENPTEAPTDAPVPTEAPTDAPVPTEAPTDAPVPTEAPTDAPVPTEAPTEAPKPTEAPVGKATVIVSGLDGESETKEFNVGDSFTVYTTLNTSAYENGGIDAIDGSQTYTASVLSLVDEYDPEGGEILNPADLFPVTGDDMIANGKTSGKITFNASQASIKDPYRFGSDASVLIQSHYTVTAPGTAEIKTTLKTLAIADEPLTKIIDQGEIQDGYKNFRLHSSFIEPALQPTTAPTEAPKPTETPVTITDGYYLVGTMTDWKADPAYKFSENTANPGEYMLSTTLAATDGIKALKVENGAITAWYPNGVGDEYNVDAAHAGDVTVYFKPTYQSDWSAFGGYLYIDGGSTPTPDMITVKFTNTNNWGTVYAYCWDEDGNEPLGEWSGTVMTKSGNVYSVQIPANTYGLIFNDGNTNQTVDIGDGIADGAHWKLTGQMDGTNYKVALVTDTPEPTQTPEPSKNYVYLAPNIWDVADATERFQLYIWNDGGDELWLTGTLVGGKYQFEIPTGFTDGTFVRMDSAKPVDEWGSMWNQTVDVTLNIGKTYTIDSWDVDQGKSGGSWS